MKKLMTVIAAVAMSFGLFAEPASHFISFETADECVQDGKLVKTGWTGDASVIGLVGGYDYIGADARRDADGEPGFVGGTENTKCLKLETGSNQVVCTPGGDTDDIYFDQTVKFTGYEEAPTVTDGKIAVWMSAIEADDQVEPAVVGETNLYVTCAKVNAAGEATPTNICIGAYDIDVWHRVTIKSLGDIAAADGRAGFLVYIDGAQVGSFAGIADADALKEKFQSYSASGLLFPGLDDDDATVTAVAYQGIGELDDVAIDNLGPQFARFVEGTVVAVQHAELELTDAEGNKITVDKDGKFQAAPGATLKFAYTAEDGYFFKGGVLTQNFSGKAEQGADPFDFTDNLDAKVAVAKYADIEGNELYAASIQEAVDNDKFGMIVLVTNAVLTASVDMAGFNGDFDLAGYTVSGTWATSYANPGAGRQYLFEIGSDADVTVIGGTITSTGNNIGAFHVVGGSLTLDQVTVNASWRAIGAYDGATVEVGADAVLTTAGEDPTIFIWSNFSNRSNTEVQCSVTIAGQVSNTFAGPYTCVNLDAVIMGNGNDKFAGVELKIAEGAEIAGTTCSGIYFPCAGTLDVNGAVSGGKFGIYAKSGAVTIGEGAEIASTAEAVVAPTTNNNGANGAGNAVVLESGSAQGGYANNIVAEITDGTFESVGAGVYNFVREGADPIEACIEGGLFSNDLTDINLIAAAEGFRGKWELDEEATGFFKPATEKIPETYAITIGTRANVTLKIDGETAEDFTANEGQEYDLAVTAAEGYNKPVITFEGEPIPAGKYVFTKAGTLAASATINTYTVTFFGDSEKTNTIASQTVDHNGYVTEVPAPMRDGFEFQGWNTETNVAIVANTDFWATWKEAKPVIDPVKPGDDITIPDGADPAKFAELVESQKDTLLKAPGDVETTPTYRSYFTAAVVGDTVQFVLNKGGEDALKANADGEIVKIKPNEIAAASGDSMIAVQDPIPGFYYAVKQGNGVGNMKVVEDGILATGAELKLKFKQYSGAGFYQIVVSEKAIIGVGE